MKTVYLLRHAKSDWNAEYESDHDRPLNVRGKKAAADMGRHLASIVPAPDMIVCSTARRTRETLSILLDNTAWKSRTRFDENLYSASPQTVFLILRTLPVETDTVLLVGHQPTTGIIASALTADPQIEVPTCTFIQIDIDLSDWNDIQLEVGVLKRHIIVRHIKATHS